MPIIEKTLLVENKKGLHARPAAMFVQMVTRFDVQVKVAKQDEKVNGKSIMGLLTLGAIANTPLTITVEGEKAEDAMKAFEEFFRKQEEELLP